MNKRIKKKLNKRYGFFHYNDGRTPILKRLREAYINAMSCAIGVPKEYLSGNFPKNPIWTDFGLYDMEEHNDAK